MTAFQPEVLVSGGGDDFLMVWDWINGRARQEVGLGELAEGVRRGIRAGAGAGAGSGGAIVGEGGGKQAQDGDGGKTAGTGVAVSGIWSFETGPPHSDEGAAAAASAAARTGAVLVACEALPALLIFHLDADGKLAHVRTLLTAGNVLDVCVDTNRKRVFYAMDNVHAPGATNALRGAEKGRSEARPWIGGFGYGADGLGSERDGRDGDEDGGVSVLAVTRAINGFAAEEEEPLTAGMDEAGLGDLLYGIEHLRKRKVEMEEEEQEEAED